jgi:hypothetical protein
MARGAGALKFSGHRRLLLLTTHKSQATGMAWNHNAEYVSRRSPYCAGVAVGGPLLLGSFIGYLAVFGSALGGYAGLGPWIIPGAAIALASISYGEHLRAYARGRELGMHAIIDSVMVRSVCNAVVASAVAYGFGWFMRVI